MRGTSGAESRIHLRCPCTGPRPPPCDKSRHRVLGCTWTLDVLPFLGSVLQIYRVYPSKGRTSRVQVGFEVSWFRQDCFFFLFFLIGSFNIMNQLSGRDVVCWGLGFAHKRFRAPVVCNQAAKPWGSESPT